VSAGTRRAVAGITAFLALTSTFVVLPVYAAPGPEPEPVATSTEEVPLGSLSDPAPDADVAVGTTEPVTGVAETAPVLTVTDPDTSGFSLVGVTWTYDPAVTDTLVQVRVRHPDGAWGEWSSLSVEEAGQDTAAPGGHPRGGTEPLWTGPSTGVEAELVTRSGARPADVQLDLVDPGESPADAATDPAEILDTADAAGTMPPVRSRAQWGADESLRRGQPAFASTLKAATIHHTADANGYAADDVPAMMRSIYRYHTVSRGWADIGYNVVADSYGRLWEGRYGGLASTVIGAHAGGFNTYTFGVSMLGNYDVTAPSFAMISAVADVIAWKFALYRIDPKGTVALTSGGGTTVRWPAGTVVTLPTIFAHRDTGVTTCPGEYGYARMGDIRTLVQSRMAGYGTPTLGSVEDLSVTAQTVTVRGWTIDPFAPTSAATAAVSVDGVPAVDLIADLPRADVGRLYGDAGPLHGFSGTLTVPEGRHDVCVRLQPVSARTLPSTTCKSLSAVHPDRLLEPIGRLETATVADRRVVVRGWTFDQDAPTAVLDVHVLVNGVWSGSFPTDRARTDVAAAYPAAGGRHGYEVALALPGPGTFPVCVFGINQAGGSRNTLLGCRTVTSPAAVWSPVGSLESATVRGRTATLSGWALDGDTPTTPLSVHVYVDGRFTATVTADRTRADVAALHPGTGSTHGFTAALDVAAGSHQVCAYAINAGPGTVNPRIGCATVVVTAASWNPFGAMDPVVVSGSTVVLRGWGVDPDSWTAPVRVRLYADGRYAGSVVASGTRSDVAALYPKAGTAHGFSGYLRLAPGPHTVCSDVINYAQGDANPSLGCRTVTV
jgi:hypothetical protein